MMQNRTMPRGIRHNNPGNIEKGTVKWQGLADIQSDPRFCTFISPEYGIRAIVVLFKTYKTKYRLNSLRAIITRYAPSHENPTDSYISNVAKAAGITENEPIDFRNTALLVRIVKCFIKQENGVQPYSDETIEKGIRLAK